MQRNVTNGDCPVTWCREQGPHWRHQQVVKMWQGRTVNDDPPRGVTLELQIYGPSEHEVRPVVTLIDALSLRQWDCELTIEELLQLGLQVVGTAERFSGRMK